MTPVRYQGVFAPVLTPFDANLAPNTALFIRHCKWLVAQGAGLAIFGTNSEAASLSVEERLRLTDSLLEAGVPAQRLMPGTGACATTDAVTLAKHAVAAGIGATLMLPPFFFKGVSDQGLFAYYSEVIQQVASRNLRIYLYHIPQFTQVPITLRLIEMLLKAYPSIVVGAKDSSGDWANTKAMLDNFSQDGFDVFPASESLLSKALPLGAAGCISATVNMNPLGIRAVYENWSAPTAALLQDRANAIRQIFQSTAMIPAMKCAAAEFSGLGDWVHVRPPLQQLDPGARSTLLAALRNADFAMPGFAEAMTDTLAAA